MTLTQLAIPLAASLILIPALPTRAETYGTWTASHFTPAQIAAGLASPGCDHDGDLCPNLFEYLGGSLPMERLSSFSVNLALDPFLNEVTVSFPFETDREDIDYLILVSDDLIDWAPGAIYVCESPALTYHLNGHRYVTVGVQPKPGVMLDSDNDGLSDLFEEMLVNSDPGDAWTHIGQILPGDDFDGNGTLNIDEEANGPLEATFTQPATFDSGVVATALEEAAPISPTALVVHTVLR